MRLPCMEVFDIENLYGLIVNSFRGINRLICTSPDNEWRRRLDEFYSLFNDSLKLVNPVVSVQPV